jgi:hypothetical protein
MFICFLPITKLKAKLNGIESNELKENKIVIKMCTLSTQKETLLADNHSKQKGKL